MLLTYHFIKAHLAELSTAVKAPLGLCLVWININLLKSL